MTDIWQLPAIARWEKSCGKHPTQKPLSVLVRTILASTTKGAWILDPFAGSGTTGIAANLLERRFLGIEKDEEYLSMCKARKTEIEKTSVFSLYREKLKDLVSLDAFKMNWVNENDDWIGYDLPF